MIRRRWFVWLLLIGLTACGWAQSDTVDAGIKHLDVDVRPCPGERGEFIPTSKTALDEIQTLVHVEVVRCEHRPAFQGFRGAIYLALGLYAEAAIHLERALMLDPDFAGAKVDYAQALALLGDLRAAEALISELLARQDVPISLRGVLENRLQELRNRFSWSSTASATLRTGFDTNLNSAPYRDLLTLTLPGGETVLLLSPDYRAREGEASVMDLGIRTSRVSQLSGNGLSISADLKIRRSADVPGSDFAQGDLQVLQTFRFKSGELLIGAGSSIVSFSSGGQFRSDYASVGHQWSFMACRPRIVLTLEGRAFPVNNFLDGRYAGLMGNTLCLWGRDRLGFTLRSGVDHPVGDRPGAKQIKLDMRLNWVRRIGSGSLDIDFTWAQQLDERGYSPLLENSARRKINRFASRSEYSWPLVRNWDYFISIESSNQNSNLELFQLKGRALYLGVRWVGLR